MHPQLEAERFHSCLDFINALDKCHQKEYYKRIFGLCNNEKDALNKCLKEASLNNKKRAVIESRIKRADVEKRWKKIEEEEYGEDAILKTILDRQYAKKKQESENDANSK
ncbi:CFC_HP_G0028780.mRNA.1.CDS.1 [Saccharomyces cerevisiae]|nr:CFC_HP_G0070580.mRNA.1.CDS.1 [Saccharomyces cerevisiae]CAI4981400.1 CFC_HP_G0086050.mRNA.1.CDS.1 [Saccharomyces cerevisiae]CAI5032106.1 CFC_HP_G0028780.mRNA.1.CDS.1 [Saccharomyces cerevisiae]CAI6669678.1 CFC_HP_G0070580.mRNA.1.CDS.1 [Saccharomyces cerevisiae]CAI6812915.1 CFC_HP_G0086050.mRNA.1.CDS.1 [Saccharomyces cerevisiae]